MQAGKKICFRCGLNHPCDGNYFIILFPKNVELVSRQYGNKIKFKLIENPYQLHVDLPEVLDAVI